MATYKPYKKTDSGKEEIKIPYSVLSNPPAIPTKVSELTNDSGYTTNKGTVTSVAVKMNGSEKGKVTSSGTIDLGTVLTNASEFATSAQGTKADNAMPKSGGTFKGNVTIASEHHLKTDLIKSADDSKWIAEITTNGLEIGGSGTPLRFYSSARPVVANQNKELAYTSDIPIKSATLLGTTLYLTL